jgi:carboxylesterase type B
MLLPRALRLGLTCSKSQSPSPHCTNDEPLPLLTSFPVVDHDFIPDAPSKLVKTGQFSRDVSVITGWATDDGSLFTPPTIANDSAVAAFLVITYPNLSESTVAQILALYPVSDFESQVAPNDVVNAHYYRASRMFRDAKFTCPCIDISYNVMRYSNADAWLYELNQTVFTSYYASIGSPYLGVSHFSDIPYVFNEVIAFNASSSDSLLAAQMSGSWSAFAATGIPTNPMTWPVGYSWVEFLSPAPWEAVINVFGGPYAGPAQVGADSYEGPVGMEKLLLRCAFWNSIHKELQT